MKTKKWFFNCIWLVLVLSFALLLDGCSLRPGPVKTPEGKALFRLGFSGTPDSLNPYAATDEEAEAVFALLYDTLFTVDAQTQECVNSLCREYTVSDSSSGVGRLWRLELRDDVYWSDGEKLTASDVEFSLQSLKDLSILYGYPYCETLDTTGIAIEDDTHLAMIVWGEEAYVKACLARVPILPRHIWNELPCMQYDSSGVAADPLRARREIYDVSAETSTLIGSGLYVWGGEQNGVCTLRLNEAYWNGTSRAEVVELHFGLDDPAPMLLAGELDACWDMPLTAFRSLGEDEAYRVTSGTDGTRYQIGFNFADSRSPIQTPAVRQAVEYCTSRDTLLLYAFGGGFSERGLLSPYSPYYYMDSVVFDRPFDTETAASLLKNAGWVDSNGDGMRENNGKPLSLTLLCSSEPAWKRAAQILEICFASAGMHLEIQALPAVEFADALAAGEYDLCLTSRDTWPDPWRSLGEFYWNSGNNVYARPDAEGGFSSPGSNESDYQNYDYDMLYAQVATSSELPVFGELTAKAGEFLYNDSAAVTIGFAVDYQACSRVWTGMEPYAGGGLYFTPLTLNEQFRTVFSKK